MGTDSMTGDGLKTGGCAVKKTTLVLTLLLCCVLAVVAVGCGMASQVGDGGTVAVQTTVEPTSTASTEPATITTTPPEPVVDWDDIRLRIEVSDKAGSFLVVKENDKDGKELYAGTLLEGDELNFDSCERYWLHIGLPEDISVFVNDMEISIEGYGGFFLVTETAVERTE
jgi:hypothetical protein